MRYAHTESDKLLAAETEWQTKYDESQSLLVRSLCQGELIFIQHEIRSRGLRDAESTPLADVYTSLYPGYP